MIKGLARSTIAGLLLVRCNARCRVRSRPGQGSNNHAGESARFRLTRSYGRSPAAPTHSTYFPGTDLSGCSKVDPAMKLFDHLVGAREQRGWDRKSERVGGFEVDLQLEFRGQLHRKIARLGARKNLARVIAGPPKYVEDAGAVAHQATGFGKVRGCVDGRDCVTSDDRCKLQMTGNEKWLSRHNQAGDLRSFRRHHGRFKFAVACGVNHNHALA